MNSVALKQDPNSWFEQTLLNSYGPTATKNKYFELVCLFNWSSFLLKNDNIKNSNSLQRFWNYSSLCLKDVYRLATRTNAAVSNQNIKDILSYIHSILKQDRYLQQNQLCVPFIILSWNIMIIMIEIGFLQESNQIFELIHEHHGICECSEINEHLSCANDSILSLQANIKEISILFGTFVLNAVGKHEEAFKHLSTINCSHSTKLKAVVLCQKGHYFVMSKQYKSALNELIPFSSSKFVNKNLQSVLFNCIGCCLSEMGKQQLASTWFCKSFEMNSKDMLPAWNLAYQFQKFNNKKAEIEVRTLIVEHSKRLQRYGISYFEALYTLAKRCKELTLFSQAAIFYKDLILSLSENAVQSSVEWSYQKPPLISHIYQETAYSFLQAGWLEECINICTIYIGDHSESSVELEPGRFRSISAGWKKALADEKQSVEMVLTKSDSLIVSTIKAVAICQQGLDEDALDEFKEIQKSITVLDSHNENVSEPQAKKPHVDLPFDEKSNTEIKNWSVIISHVYCNMGVLTTRKGLFTDAQHLFRVALISYPGNLDAIYNYVLLLIKIGLVGKAKRVWKEAKLEGNDLKRILESEKASDVVLTVNVETLIKLDKCLLNK